MSGAGDCLQVFRADALSCGQREQLLQRPSADAADILDFLKEAEQQVQTRGDDGSAGVFQAALMAPSETSFLPPKKNLKQQNNKFHPNF